MDGCMQADLLELDNVFGIPAVVDALASARLCAPWLAGVSGKTEELDFHDRHTVALAQMLVMDESLISLESDWAGGLSSAHLGRYNVHANVDGNNLVDGRLGEGIEGSRTRSQLLGKRLRLEHIAAAAVLKELAVVDLAHE